MKLESQHQCRRVYSALYLTDATVLVDIETEMDAEQIIAEIEWLERIFAVPYTRPPSASDFAAANQRHDEVLAHSPLFRIR